MKIDIIKINKIIDKEIEFAREVNQQMAFGMLHVKRILNDYDDELEKEANKQKLEVCPKCLSAKYHWDYDFSDLLRCEHCGYLFNEDEIEIIDID